MTMSTIDSEQAGQHSAAETADSGTDLSIDLFDLLGIVHNIFFLYSLSLAICCLAAVALEYSSIFLYIINIVCDLTSLFG